MEEFFCVIICVSFVSGSLGRPSLPTSKLSVATWGSYHQNEHKGPGTYAFGYDIEDSATGNIQFKQEERHPNGTVTGSYGYVDDDGKPHVVTYISDERGYRAKVEKEGEPTQYFPDANSFGLPSRKEVSNTKHVFGLEQDFSDYVSNTIDGNNRYNNINTPNNFPAAASQNSVILYPFNYPLYFKEAPISGK